MSSSQSPSDPRVEMRGKQREETSSVDFVFDDSLHRFICSNNNESLLRSVSQELANKEDTIKIRIRAVLDRSQEILGLFSPSRAERFVEQREFIVEELATHLKSSRVVVKEARARNVVDDLTAKRLLSRIEDIDGRNFERKSNSGEKPSQDRVRYS